MKFYVQHDGAGNITGTVYSDGPAPECEHQVVLDDLVSIAGMCIDPATGALVPCDG